MADAPPLIHRPERSHVELSGSAEVHQFLENAYAAKVRRLKQNNPGNGPLSLVHTRVDVGLFAIDEVELSGDVEMSIDPLHKVVGTWVIGGRVVGHSGGIAGAATAGEVKMVAQPGLPHDAHTEDLHHTVVQMEPALVAGLAAGVPAGQAPMPARFSSFGAVDAPAARRWKATVSYLQDAVLAPDALATALVLGQAGRLLAAVTLSTFPNAAITDPAPYDRTDHQPALLRRTIEYIEANVTEDISLAHIADAARVTPRAVQYMFRRHLDTTPMRYLRRARLHHAHQELLGGDPTRDTVTAIAAHWGFMNPGRFATLYRRTYGQSPHTTLRGSVHSVERAALLLRTLWAYRGLGDLTRTAVTLNVYPSTVRYRLYRIRELTGYHPNDPRSIEVLRGIANPHHQ